MITLSTAKRSAGGFAIDGDRRRVDRAGEPRRVQLQRLDLAVAEHRGHGPAVQQLDAFFEHVVQILGHGRHLLGVALDRDHRHFHGALPQRLAGAVDRRVAAADHRDARAELHLRRAHADVAQEGQSVEHAVLVLALGAHAVGLGEADRQDARRRSSSSTRPR